MLFNAISAHKKKLVADAEEAEEEEAMAKEKRRKINAERDAAAMGLKVGEKKIFMDALSEKRAVRCRSTHTALMSLSLFSFASRLDFQWIDHFVPYVCAPLFVSWVGTEEFVSRAVDKKRQPEQVGVVGDKEGQLRGLEGSERRPLGRLVVERLGQRERFQRRRRRRE